MQSPLTFPTAVPSRQQVAMQGFRHRMDKARSAVSLRVPNEFGALCGTPNAYSMITFPMCPSTKKTLAVAMDDPSRVMGRVEAQYEDFDRAQMLKSIDKALAIFPDGDGM
ncbi:MAG: hypothetical protein ABI557_16865 [Aureliella sp.]